jgi:hypothetical protein
MHKHWGGRCMASRTTLTCTQGLIACSWGEVAAWDCVCVCSSWLSGVGFAEACAWHHPHLTAAYQHLLVAHVCTAVGWLRWEVGLCLLMYVCVTHSAYMYVHVLYMCICVMADITVAHSVVGIWLNFTVSWSVLKKLTVDGNFYCTLGEIRLTTSRLTHHNDNYTQPALTHGSPLSPSCLPRPRSL